MSEAELAESYYAHRKAADVVGEQVDYVPPRAARCRGATDLLARHAGMGHRGRSAARAAG